MYYWWRDKIQLYLNGTGYGEGILLCKNWRWGTKALCLEQDVRPDKF